MTLEAQETSVVVLGAWNPAIISPPWLGKYGIVEKMPEEVEAVAYPLRAHFHFDIGGFAWDVDNTRLAIKADEPLDCGSLVARILGLLPHTPVRAVGTNFGFHFSPGDWPDECRPRLEGIAQQVEGKGSPFVEMQWQGARELGEDTKLRITVAEEPEEGVVVRFNLQRTVDSAERAAEFAGKWAEDRETVIGLLKDLFGKEIK